MNKDKLPYSPWLLGVVTAAITLAIIGLPLIFLEMVL